MSTIAPAKPVKIVEVVEKPVSTSALIVTPLAVSKIKNLLAEKGLTEHGLRVFIAGGGGCSGFQYGMAFEKNPQESDHIIEIDGVRLIIDAMSLPYLEGSNIDFIDGPMGGGFRIENPNAVSECGCGGGSCGCHS
jgi:iron-sulfur cluster assembly protein